jgi:predicted CoA-binding protein
MSDEDARLLRILKTHHTIAVVGMSANPEKDSHTVPAYLVNHGYHVIPVNPNAAEVLGRKSYPRLSEVPEPVDLVLVFRPSADVPPIAEEAVRIGAKAIWMQLGISHEAAASSARRAGLEVVMDNCIRVTHSRLLAAHSSTA